MYRENLQACPGFGGGNWASNARRIKVGGMYGLVPFRVLQLKIEDVVIERRGVTYYVRPVGDDSARVMRRHYDDLEAAPQQMLSWEESEDSRSCSDTERDVIRERPVSPRYPRRERRPTRRLQMDARNKEYDERASWASDNSYSSDYDSD